MEISSENKIKPAQGIATLPYLPKGLVGRSKCGVREHRVLPSPERSGESGEGWERLETDPERSRSGRSSLARDPAPCALGLGDGPAPSGRCPVLYPVWLKTKGPNISHPKVVQKRVWRRRASRAG